MFSKLKALFTPRTAHSADDVLSDLDTLVEDLPPAEQEDAPFPAYTHAPHVPSEGVRAPARQSTPVSIEATEGSPGASSRLGGVLVAKKLISPQQLEFALKRQAHERAQGQVTRLGETLQLLGFCPESAVVAALQEINPDNIAITVDVPASLCAALQVKPLGLAGTVLRVAPISPLSAEAKSQLVDAVLRKGMSCTSVEEDLSFANEVILATLAKMTVDTDALGRNVAEFNRDPDGGGVVTVLESTLHDALQQRVSDIHVDYGPTHGDCKVSYRIDNVVSYQYGLSRDAARALFSFIKDRANMDMSDRFNEQDGNMAFVYNGRPIGVRVATQPTGLDGETCALRLLDPNAVRSVNEQFADHPTVRDAIRQITQIKQKASGMVLVSGPTGSGKSSTLAGCMRDMNRIGLNIMTVEHPIEQYIPEVRQASVRGQMTFARLLKSMMRQDPDIIMVGELRDPETVEACMSAVESGHLTLSTTHADSCASSITRLTAQMTKGYRPIGFVTLASSLTALINQRLVHRVCRCATRLPAGEVASADVLAELGLSPTEPVAVAQGCSVCGGTGYFGRVILPEAAFFNVNDNPKMREAMLDIMRNDRSPTELLTVPGVVHYSRKDSALQIIRNGATDIKTAYSALKG